MSTDSERSESSLSLPTILRWVVALLSLGAAYWWNFNAGAIGEGMINDQGSIFWEAPDDRAAAIEYLVIPLALAHNGLILLLWPLAGPGNLPRILCLLGSATLLSLLLYLLAGANIFRSSENLYAGVLPTEFHPWWETPDGIVSTFDQSSFRGIMLLRLTSGSIIFVAAALLFCGLGAGRLRTPALLGVVTLLSAIALPLSITWHFYGWLTDAKGSGLIGLLAGAAGLALLLGARFLPARHPDGHPGTDYRAIPLEPPRPSRTSQSVLWIGLLFSVAWMLATSYAITRILATEAEQSQHLVLTALIMISACLVAYGASFLLGERSRLLIVISASFAGWAASSPTQLTAVDAIMLGTIAGGLCTVALFLFDRLQLDDPLGITAALLIGSLVGKVAIGVLDDELIPQLLSIVSVFGVGFFTGSAVAFLAHIFGWLWKPEWAEETQNAPDPPPESTGA